MTYYNENDKRAAAWLRELIRGGHIAPGDVDERSICEVRPADLFSYEQCHFFAGIGGWSYALRLAGVADSVRVWTGSCPCQPFSSAGKQLGNADRRHLWPEFMRLIAQCRPKLVFGEQVASAIGRGWLDGVSADLEAHGYACGATVLGAHSVGAPHMRQRLYWMAHGAGWGLEGGAGSGVSRGRGGAECGGSFGGVGDAEGGDELRVRKSRSGGRLSAGGSGADGGLEQPDCGGRGARGIAAASAGYGGAALANGRAGGLAHGDGDGRAEHERESRGWEMQGPLDAAECGGVGGLENATFFGRGEGADDGRCAKAGIAQSDLGGSACGPWGDFDLLPCTDGRARRVEAGTFPLAVGVSGRVGLLRGYGNAIVPQLAAEFVAVGMEILAERRAA